MRKVLVIGYGNTLRGDDAAGIRAVDRLAKLHPEFECICMHQLMPELAERIAENDTVFFFDADVQVTHVALRLVLPSEQADQPRTHFISPESLLRLSQELYQRVPNQAYIVGIPASRFDFSEQLSERTEKAVEESLVLVESFIKNT